MESPGNFFITGGAGFIANKLIHKLIQNDKNRITVFDNFRRDTLSDSGLAQHKNLRIVKGDVMDYESVKKHMEGADTVIHAAAVSGIDTVIKRPTETMKVNMIGTANVLGAAVENKISKRVIVFSTSEVLGSYTFKQMENSQAKIGTVGEARWTYAVSKLASEHLAFAYYKEYGLPVVTVRPFNIYGPGQTGESAMLIFIKNVLKNECLNIYGDGIQIRAWCYIDDFIDCLMKCIYYPEAIGESFNIGNGRTVLTIYGLAQTICRVLNSDSEILFKPPLSADVELRVPSVEKASNLLGFKAKVSIEEGILRTAEWLKSEVIRKNGQSNKQSDLPKLTVPLNTI